MRSAALLLALLPAAAAAQTGPTVQLGAEMARQWCSGCHQVAPSDPAKDTVPGFPAIAVRAGTSEATLSAFLRKPHGQMPDLTLSERDIRALAAYILSLKAHP